MMGYAAVYSGALAPAGWYRNSTIMGKVTTSVCDCVVALLLTKLDKVATTHHLLRSVYNMTW